MYRTNAKISVHTSPNNNHWLRCREPGSDLVDGSRPRIVDRSRNTTLHNRYVILYSLGNVADKGIRHEL